MSNEDVKSPCISVCWLNEDNICEGCYRNAEEITVWSVSGNQEKHQIMEKVAVRRKALNDHGLV